jgi:hypothetical protein
MKTHLMWDPNAPTYADVGDVVGKAFAAGLRPDPVEAEPAPADLPPELIEALVRDTLRQHLDALIPVLAREITQRLR